jgi:CHAT domain-containing protein
VYLKVLRDGVAAWTLTQHGVSVDRTNVTVGALETARAAIATAAVRQDAAALRTSGRVLYDLLLRPPLARLPGVTRLVIVPDRSLWLVPYAALYQESAGRFLAQDYVLTLAGNLADAMAAATQPRPPVPRQARVLTVGASEPSCKECDELAALPFAAREAEAVGALYGKQIVLTGRAATVAAFGSAAPHADVIHFAGHAVVNAEHPDNSRLVFTRAGEDDPGSLELGAIRQMRLPATRVVVVAGCQTLGTYDGPNTGVVGLAEAFFATGVPNVVATLWEIGDRGAAGFFSRLHRELADSVDPASALHDAQVHEITNALTKPETSTLDWAAVVLVAR